MSVELSSGMRRIQISLADILRTCFKELKQTATGIVEVREFFSFKESIFMENFHLLLEKITLSFGSSRLRVHSLTLASILFSSQIF